MSESPWLRQFHTPPAQDSALIVCPHAGSGASSYRALSAELSHTFAVHVAQYPGRQDRRHEPAATTLEELGAGIAAAVTTEMPYATSLIVLGHSVGSIIAFEVARHIEAAGTTVSLLVASAAVAPSDVADGPRHPTSDTEIVDRLVALHGTAPDVLANREVLAMTLPALKADYAAINGYDCAPDTQVRADILAIGGEGDPIVSPRDLHRWSLHTTGSHRVALFSGGHFYIDHNHAPVANAVVAAAGIHD